MKYISRANGGFVQYLYVTGDLGNLITYNSGNITQNVNYVYSDMFRLA
jgi:hypothetical protein